MSEFVSLPSNGRWTESAPLVPDPPPWRNDGACRGINPDIFFPERGESTTEAKQICGMCPVRGECLDYALDQVIKYGIWGGTSERERRRMRSPRSGRNPWAAERRRQVQTMAEQGLLVTDIARDLGMSARTIHRYLQPDLEAS